MEDVGNRSGKKRGRKRKQIDVEKVEVPKVGRKRLKEIQSMALVGRYVRKEFKGSGVYLGKIVGYETGLYRVDYEDGDCEDLDSGELRHLLVEDSELTDKWLVRKTKLDKFLLTKRVKGDGNPNVGVNNVEKAGLVKGPVEVVDSQVENRVELDSSRVLYADLANYKVKLPALVPLENGFADNIVERPTVIALGFFSSEGPVCGGGVNETVQPQLDIDGTTDSVSDSCEEDVEEDQSLEEEVPLVPCPVLPPSSGNIGVPEDCVDHLFSVYSFLRSFSVQLFLYPFRLDDFVGSLNCPGPNTLLDSIHVALLRALRRHFEKLSSDGSEAASKCLRTVDWSLLDSVTWPVYLIHYLMLMRHTDGPEWKGFYAHSLEREFYSLPVGRKLVVLQILCDDVLDSEYLRAEIDTREISEFGSEAEVDTIVATPMHVPRKVHPRNSKTSACKVQEAIASRSHEMKTYCISNQLVSNALRQGVSSNLDQDGNSDECLLCGMEGTLLCCDGCPASYHSRCLGVMKSFLPEGPWYCPECLINKLGPRILRGTALKGSDTFGVDLYGQVFVGTCDHLLVLNSRSNEASCLRYYCPSDIANVLQALQTNKEHMSMYLGICKDIVQYWELPEDLVFLGKTSEGNDCLSKEDSKISGLSLKLLDADGHCVSEITESVDNVSYATGNSSCTVIPNNSCNTMITTNHSGENGHGEATSRLASSLVKSKVPGEIQGTSTTLSGPISQKTTLSDVCKKETSGLVVASCNSRNITSSCTENGNPLSASMNPTIQHNVKRVGLGSRQYQRENDYSYSGSSFKSQGYVNHYLHGEFAASAAANNMTAISTEENQITGADRRKIASAIAANMALQAKAFSSAAVRFFWPYTEKKLIEVPRERCGWCLACEANVTSRKGCLLNAAASNAIKGPLKILATLRPLKTGEGRLLGIATYIIFMEESLSGLTVGPFQSPSFRAQWRAQMEQANTCSEIKFLLLELEENLRTIALSGDWVKLVDGSSAESSVIQPSAIAAGSTQKRRPGRRGRKPAAITEVNPDVIQESDTTWWRGGMLSVLLYQKGLLPRSLVKKAARQGGSRKVHGIYYAEGPEAGKRSRRLVWRAAVDTSRTISQLAQQVRYLDLHVRWSDLHPENSVQDTKGPETEASAFRNADICDKKVVDNEIRYCIAFEKQKHLPSRVLKSIVEEEQSQADIQKYWFPETRVPLYLIRKFEQHAAEVPSVVKHVPVKSKLRRKRLFKASMADIVLYLTRKRDNVEQQYCAFCNLDVFLSDGDSVRCSLCEGLCHKQCTNTSLVFFDDGAEDVSTCKKCCNSQITDGRSIKMNGSPTSPLLIQGQNCPSRTGPKEPERIANVDQSSASIDTRPSPSESKPSVPSNSGPPKGGRSWGLIWVKKPEDDGTEFRIKHLLLKGENNVDSSALVCQLCKHSYNPELMYIRCDTCMCWFHAEAVELDESKIFQLVGFKCCRCRRIRSPVCPYDETKKNRPLEKRVRNNGPKSEGSNKKLGVGSVSQPIRLENEVGVDTAGEPSTRSAPQKLIVRRKGLEEKKIRIRGPKPVVSDYKPDLSFLSEQFQSENGNNSILTRRENSVNAAVDDSHLYSYPGVAETTQYGNLSGATPQKLPVRRHTHREKDADNTLPSDPPNLESTTPVGQNTVNPSVPTSPCVEWGVSSTNGFDDSATINYDTITYEDMEFEPQTYFSFNELLTTNDSDHPPPSTGVVADASLSPFPDYAVTDTFDDPDELTFPCVPCKFCSQSEPYPELFCHFCGICIHSHCSPWEGDDLAASFDSWSCGDCRTAS